MNESEFTGRLIKQLDFVSNYKCDEKKISKLMTEALMLLKESLTPSRDKHVGSNGGGGYRSTTLASMLNFYIYLQGLQVRAMRSWLMLCHT